MAKGGTKKGDWRKRMRGFVKANTSLTIIISALLLIELMMGVMYYAAQNFIQNTMERLVRVEMNATFGSEPYVPYKKREPSKLNSLLSG